MVNETQKSPSDDPMMNVENVHICVTCDNLKRGGDCYYCAVDGDTPESLAFTCLSWVAYKPSASCVMTDTWVAQQFAARNRRRMAELSETKKDEQRENSDRFRTTEYGNYNRTVYVSLDPGKKQDYSALILLEPFLPIESDQDVEHFIYHISRIHRFPLETPYPMIARTLRKVYQQLIESPDFDYVYIVIDEGGVGTAVADQIVELVPEADVYRVAFTSGLRAKWQDARNLSVPKPQLASTLISLFESRRLWVTPKQQQQLDELRGELMTYERKITAAGYDSFGAIKMCAHDDIISAIAMAAYLAEEFGGGNTPLFW